jgi:hypothetical protein
VTLKVDHVALQRLRDDGGLVDVVSEPRLPLLLLLGHRGLDVGDHRGGRDRPRAWESLHQLTDPEEMIEVPMSDVDRGQPLTGLLDHVAKCAHLGLDVARVGQDGLGRCDHESRGARRPVLAVCAELTQRGGEHMRAKLNVGGCVGRHRRGAPIWSFAA